MANLLAITPNGHVVYAYDAYEMGILGVNSLVIDDLPVARFTFAPGPGSQVSFDANTSETGSVGDLINSVMGETLTSYAWNFGDSSTGTGITPTHTFGGPGPYTVKLTVTSSTAQTDSIIESVLGGSIAGLKGGVTYHVREVVDAGWLLTTRTADNVHIGSGHYVKG
jgi:PKD repeat protein